MDAKYYYSVEYEMHVRGRAIILMSTAHEKFDIYNEVRKKDMGTSMLQLTAE